jgi:hypothetical protein
LFSGPGVPNISRRNIVYEKIIDNYGSIIKLELFIGSHHGRAQSDLKTKPFSKIKINIFIILFSGDRQRQVSLWGKTKTKHSSPL